MLRIFQMFFLVLLSGCAISGQSGSNTKTINGMEFSSLTLPNQLEVLLVQDPRFKKSSAAMAVGVGSLEDPETAQGMAHYLEHMLFLGTKEYPKIDDYSNYMETHGGWDNAYTSDEETNYMFEVDNNALEGALQRFSRFFVSPLFDSTYVEREKNAVNSEFEKNIKQDNWREDRYVNLLASKDHSFRKFSTGNLKTLGKVTREDVLRFYNQYYSSNNMKLVVMGAAPTEQMRAWVEKYFKDIPNKKINRVTYPDEFFDPNLKAHVHFIKSIADEDEMSILFNVPNDTPYWKSKPLNIIATIIGDEGPGSLLSVLKKEGLALELSASQSFWRTFSISIVLTPKGLANYRTVLQRVANFLELIKEKKYPEYLFRDEKAMSQIMLENLEPSSSGQRAASFAKNLLDYPAREFLERKYLLHEYSLPDFELFLQKLDLKNAHVIIRSKSAKVAQKEDIFGVEYRQSTESLDFPKDNMIFAYPQTNKYIPTDFRLVTKKRERLAPEKKLLSDGALLYSRVDTELGLAKAFIKFNLTSAVENNVKNMAHAVLFTICKSEELNEWLYPIGEAGAQFSISNGMGADEIHISVSGYSQRLQQVLRDALVNKESGQKLNHLHIHKKLFEDIKQRLKKDFQNTSEMVAFQRLGMEAQYVQSNKAFYWKDLLREMEKARFEDVQAYGQKFFQKFGVDVVAYGNIENASVEPLIKDFYTQFSAQALPRTEVQKRKALFRVVPDGKKYSRPVVGRNNNFAMMSYSQWAPWTIENHAKILVVSQLLSQPYFSELRTRQQLGYVARASGQHGSGYVGVVSAIQSPKVKSLQLHEKSQQFLKQFFTEKIKTLTEEELRPILQTIENELLVTPTTLPEREKEFYQSAIKYEGKFQIRESIAAVIKGLKVQDIRSFIENSFLKKDPAQLTFYYFDEKSVVGIKKLPGTVVENVDTEPWQLLNPYPL